jgi:hypothetical protein
LKYQTGIENSEPSVLIRKRECPNFLFARLLGRANSKGGSAKKDKNAHE